jgi:hypothetical protein
LRKSLYLSITGGPETAKPLSHGEINQFLRAMGSETDDRTVEQCIEGCKMTRATTLDLSGLGIEKVPEELSIFTWLTELNLHENELTEIPDFIGNLKTLKKLTILVAPIKELPGSIDGCTDLETIEFLSLDFLLSLPESLANLSRLKIINLNSGQDRISIPKRLERFIRHRS